MLDGLITACLVEGLGLGINHWPLAVVKVLWLGVFQKGVWFVD